MKLIAGIDEAGRGSIIGPMVIAGIVFKEEDVEKLIEINVRDSKELKPHLRNMLLEKILELAYSWKLVLISAKEVNSETRRSGGGGITNLEAKIFAEILNHLKPDIAYIDLPSINVERFREKLTMNLTHNCALILEHEADKKYPVTAAASIIAKVHRDEEVRKLREKFGDFGSGYPHDPKTREFLKKIFKTDSEAKEHVRWSWRTVDDLAQSRLEDYEV